MRALALALALGALVEGARGAAVPQQQQPRVIAAAQEGAKAEGVRVHPRLVEKPLVFPSALFGKRGGGDAGGEGLPVVDPPER
jgi:hypothetical protein